MNTRLKQFLAAENISQSQFADTINVVRASVSHVLSGRNNPGYDFIKAIMAAYPSLNMEWLILGKGKMYKENPLEPVTSAPIHDFPIDEEPGLFDERSFIDQPVHDAVDDPAPIRQFTAPEPQSITSYVPTQNIVTQRKVVKVTIFFDDGTYQEM